MNVWKVKILILYFYGILEIIIFPFLFSVDLKFDVSTVKSSIPTSLNQDFVL